MKVRSIESRTAKSKKEFGISPYKIKKMIREDKCPFPLCMELQKTKDGRRLFSDSPLYDYFSAAAAALFIGMPQCSLRYNLDKGRIKGVPIEGTNRYIFSEKECIKLKSHLDK